MLQKSYRVGFSKHFRLGFLLASLSSLPLSSLYFSVFAHSERVCFVQNEQKKKF